jgi:hypothetical protein
LRGGRGRRRQMPDRLDIHANPIRKNAQACVEGDCGTSLRTLSTPR